MIVDAFRPRSPCAHVAYLITFSAVIGYAGSWSATIAPRQLLSPTRWPDLVLRADAASSRSSISLFSVEALAERQRTGAARA